MRMYEVASAEEQLALWQLINQSVWAAIEQQRQQQQQRAQQAVKAQRSKVPSGAVVGRAAVPFKPVPVQSAAVSKPVNTLANTAAAVQSAVPDNVKQNNSKRKDAKDVDADRERSAAAQRENSDSLWKTRKPHTKQLR
jgi:hypothetical protein